MSKETAVGVGSTSMVTLTIDGQSVQVAKGTNLIEAAKLVETEVPYYCYHPHLSIAGNCRMCQVEIEGAPKLTIACNTVVQEGMVVRTQRTSEKVKEAQRATLEFLLINHPLDCTVCDQAGHCKLQDYYYEYNRKPSRFIEAKEHKVKAEIFGPEVIYDGERCIVCTRCVRFCDEVTETSELAVLNRGDRSVIAIDPERPLDNALSGSVVDLCPVGALTHRRWRFNTRMWYTNQQDSICVGCSTGCNAKVAVRDGEVVQVKARLNSEVNQEWMCDEGRYGFERFQPQRRLTSQFVREGDYLQEVVPAEAYALAAKLSQRTEALQTAVFLSPFLTLEEIWVSLLFTRDVMGLAHDSSAVALQIKTRSLNSVEQRLISPDMSPNARAFNIFGLAVDTDWRAALAHRYQTLLSQLRSGAVKRVLLVGDSAILSSDIDERLIKGIRDAEISVAITPHGLLEGEGNDDGISLGAHQFCSVVFPAHTVHEKNGCMVNKDLRIQRLRSLLQAPIGSYPDWLHLQRIAQAAKVELLPQGVGDERSLFRAMVSQVPQLQGLTLLRIGELGIGFEELEKIQTMSEQGSKSAAL